MISKELIDELQSAFENAKKEYYENQKDPFNGGTFNGLTIARNIVWKYK